MKTILKSVRETLYLWARGVDNSYDSRFLIHRVQKEVAQYFPFAEEKNCQSKILYPVKISFKNKREIKTFSDEEKLREFATSRPTLRERLKKVL